MDAIVQRITSDMSDMTAAADMTAAVPLFLKKTRKDALPLPLPILYLLLYRTATNQTTLNARTNTSVTEDMEERLSIAPAAATFHSATTRSQRW